MKIHFRRYDGKGDVDDPKAGTPWDVTLESFLAWLRGQVVTGASGISPHTQAVTISFSDNSQIWFITTHGIPRILYQEPF